MTLEQYREQYRKLTGRDMSAAPIEPMQAVPVWDSIKIIIVTLIPLALFAIFCIAFGG